MTRYRKRPIEVEAIVYDGVGDNNNGLVIADWMEEEDEGQLVQPDHDWGAPTWPLRIWIEYRQARGRIEVGDAVIRESDGSGYYPCAKAVFEATYEPVEDL
jgi:hypothetical protein